MPQVAEEAGGAEKPLAVPLPLSPQAAPASSVIAAKPLAATANKSTEASEASEGNGYPVAVAHAATQLRRDNPSSEATAPQSKRKETVPHYRPAAPASNQRRLLPLDTTETMTAISFKTTAVAPPATPVQVAKKPRLPPAEDTEGEVFFGQLTAREAGRSGTAGIDNTEATVVSFPKAAAAASTPRVTHQQPRPALRQQQQRPVAPAASSPTVVDQRARPPIAQQRRQHVPQQSPPPQSYLLQQAEKQAQARARQTQQAQVPLKENEVSVSGTVYSKIERLGKGGSSVVYRVLSNEDHKMYGLKEVDLSQADEETVST